MENNLSQSNQSKRNNFTHLLSLGKGWASPLALCGLIWLAPRAGKMNQIARYDWLPEWAR